MMARGYDTLKFKIHISCFVNSVTLSRSISDKISSMKIEIAGIKKQISRFSNWYKKKPKNIPKTSFNFLY